MNMKLYQIDPKKDVHNIKFLGMDSSLRRKVAGTSVDASIYNCVYEMETKEVGLEELYVIFNIEKPADFHGHSMSVSDVVGVFGASGKEVEDGFYYCDKTGFVRVEFDSLLCSQGTFFNEDAKERKHQIHVLWGDLDVSLTYAREQLGTTDAVAYYPLSDHSDASVDEWRRKFFVDNANVVITTDIQLIRCLQDWCLPFELISVQGEDGQNTVVARHFSMTELWRFMKPSHRDNLY